MCSVRTGREQRVPDSIACAQTPPTLACGSGLWGNTCGTCHPQHPAHTLSKYANTRVWRRLWLSTLFPCYPQLLSHTLSLTLLLQNHLDHVNILLQGLWARPPVLSLVPLRANHNSPKITSTIRSGICGTGTSTICCAIRFDIHSSGITLITSTICSWICGTGTAITISGAPGAPVDSYADTRIPKCKRMKNVCLERMTSTPAAFGPALLALPTPRKGLPRARASSPFESGGSFGSSCNKNVTQKRTQTRQAHDPHFCLSLDASYQERASNRSESHSP